MQIYPFSQLRNKGFSLFQSCFYKSGMLPFNTHRNAPFIDGNGLSATNNHATYTAVCPTQQLV